MGNANDLASLIIEGKVPVDEGKTESPSAARALNILEYFGTQGRPLRARDIAGIFQICPSSTHQLLKTLVNMAFLTFNPRTKFYFPSSRLIAFATMLSGHYGGNQLIRLLSELHAETGEAVWLLTLCDTQIQIVESLQYPYVKGFKYSVDSIPGNALLAQYPNETMREAVDRAVLYRDCPQDRAQHVIRNSIAARDAGYASGYSVHPQLWNLSVPLPRPVGDVPLVLSLSGEKKRVRSRQEELLKILQAGVKRVLH